MPTLLDVAAPAKLNLFLHVTGRRSDGYHLLQSLFTFIDWQDTLHFDCRADGVISREDLQPSNALPADDLIVRAARRLQAATGCPLGVHIGLHKTIPMQAGLGGGSSDAASTLIALNRLWKLGLSRAQLSELGLSLGADVPFFIGGRSAWVEGVGDAITPLDVPPTTYLVVKPPAGLSTPEIFSHPSLKRDTARVTITGFVARAAQEARWTGSNDLQPVAEMLCADVRWGIAELAKRGLDGRMTGSGSAMFAPCTHDTPTNGWPDGWLARVCNNFNVHPLFGWC